MQYVLLINAAESRYADPSTREAIMKAYGTFSREFFSSGVAGDSAALSPTETATTVRVREGKRVVQDGPFAETREQLAGYYSLRAETPEEAFAWAAKIPDAKGGTIEVRPLISMPTAAPASESAPRDEAANKQYMMLLYESATVRDARSEAERNGTFGRYLALNEELRSSGRMIAGAPLDNVAKAKSVSVVGEQRVVRDGPFAETREQLGGYYRVWAKDLDDAIAIAARIPAAETGTVEVRPVMDTGAMT